MKQCKYCKGHAYGPYDLCRSCQEKSEALRKYKVFRTDAEAERAKLISQRRPLPKPPRLERPDTYKHKLGSETKKLIDFVNKSGTIHYGRFVAQQRGKER